MIHKNTDLLSSGRIFPSRFFEPVLESPEDIVTHTNPQGKRVLSVAAYGYPLVFLSEGANQVLSFDVDYNKVAWNHFLRASLLALDYEENLGFLRHEIGGHELSNVERKVREHIPEEYVEKAMKYMFIFTLSYSHLADRITQIYPHVRDRDTYRKARKIVNNGGWEISQDELLTLLEGVERFQSGQRFDVMYTSSIRNWVLDARYNGDTQRFEEEYDRELGRLVSSLLDEDGIFYEVLISAEGFPRVRISPRLYRGFGIQEYDSCDDDETVIVVGRKYRTSPIISEPTPS